jgi:hypothetical protein
MEEEDPTGYIQYEKLSQVLVKIMLQDAPDVRTVFQFNSKLPEGANRAEIPYFRGFDLELLYRAFQVSQTRFTKGH